MRRPIQGTYFYSEIVIRRGFFFGLRCRTSDGLLSPNAFATAFGPQIEILRNPQIVPIPIEGFDSDRLEHAHGLARWFGNTKPKSMYVDARDLRPILREPNLLDELRSLFSEVKDITHSATSLLGYIRENFRLFNTDKIEAIELRNLGASNLTDFLNRLSLIKLQRLIILQTHSEVSIFGTRQRPPVLNFTNFPALKEFGLHDSRLTWETRLRAILDPLPAVKKLDLSGNEGLRDSALNKILRDYSNPDLEFIDVSQSLPYPARPNCDEDGNYLLKFRGKCQDLCRKYSDQILYGATDVMPGQKKK